MKALENGISLGIGKLALAASLVCAMGTSAKAQPWMGPWGGMPMMPFVGGGPVGGPPVVVPPPAGGGGGGGARSTPTFTPPAPVAPPRVPVVNPPLLPPPAPPRIDIPRPVSTILPTDGVQVRMVAEFAQQEAQAGNYQFACHTCTGVVDKEKKGVVFPVRGSLYAFDADGNVKLARGRVAVLTETDSITISAGRTNTVVPAHSSVIVEVIPNGLTHVYSLTAGDLAASVSLDDSQQTVALNPGRELVAAANDIAEQELIPVDGIARRPVEGSLTARNTRVNEFSIEQLQRKNMLLACREIDFHPHNKAGQMLAATKRTMESLAQTQLAFSPSDIKQSALTQGVLNTSAAAATVAMTPAVASGPQTGKFAGGFLAAGVDSQFEFAAQDMVNLKSGSLLVNTRQPLKVNFNNRQVQIARNAVVLVEGLGQSLKVVNLSDQSQHAVKVVIGNYSHSLKNGQELLLTHHAPALGEIYNVSRIGHRGMDSQQIGDDGWATVSHVYIPHVLAHHPLLKHARSHAHGKQVAEQVLRTAAALQVLGNNPFSYQQGQPEDETAQTIVSASCKNCR